jgi:ribosomal protein L28
VGENDRISVLMSTFAVKFPRVAHFGHKVSHAKNRTNRAFKYNLQTITVTDEGGKKVRMRVPVKLARTMKKRQTC